MSDDQIVASLIDGAHTWACLDGHQSVTWEAPPPVVGDLRQCAECWHPLLDPVRVVSVASGLPLAKVREYLGRGIAARILAAGSAV